MAAPVDNTVGEAANPQTSRITARDYADALISDRVALLAVAYLAFLFAFALFAEFSAPHQPTGLNLSDRLLPPGATGSKGAFYLLGTDELGRDLFSRLIYGARVSVSVGLLGATVSCVVGVAAGLTAGYYGGLYEDVVMRLVDGMLSLPSLLVALFVLFVLGGGYTNLILVFSVLHWMVFCRLSRGLALSARSSTYVQASKALGAPSLRIVFRHILPNVTAPIIVLFTLEIAILILSEASLSFLGFGVQPPDPSWGLMLADGREHIRSAWWLVTFPGLAIFLTALSLNLLANWVRAVTDPVQRWRWFARGAGK